MPAIGDLFRGKNQDIQETIDSVFHMLRLRVQDQEFRTEMRTKMAKNESEKSDLAD